MQEIRLDTFAKLLEHGYGLDCWRSGCRRWASCDLAMVCPHHVNMRQLHVPVGFERGPEPETLQKFSRSLRQKTPRWQALFGAVCDRVVNLF